MSAFPEAKIKTFVRTECLREENGKPRVLPERVLRVLFLVKEGVSMDAPPLWHRVFDEGENTEETLDVDGLVERIRQKSDDEVGSSTVPVVFRLCAIHGQNSNIAPSLISAQIPFTLHPIRRISPGASSSSGSPYAQSFEDATETGLAALMMRGMRQTQEMYFPELQNVIAEKNTTIDDLRAALRAANETLDDLRDRLEEAEDKHIDRVIRLRDSALKQRLKERGGRLVINALTLLASNWMMPGGGQGGGQAPPPKMGRGPNAALGGGPGGQNGQGGGQAPPSAPTSAPASGKPQASQAPQASSEASQGGRAVPNPPPGMTPDDVVWISANAARLGQPWDMNAVFGEFVEEIMPVVGNLAGVVTPDQQGLLWQAFQVHQKTGTVDLMVLQRFAEDLGEDGDLSRLQMMMQRLPSDRAKMAFATILHGLKTNYDRDVEEDRNVERDIQGKVAEVTRGELVDVEPEIPDDLVEEIKVRKPRVVTREKAAEERKKKRATGVTVKSLTSSSRDKSKPL